MSGARSLIVALLLGAGLIGLRCGAASAEETVTASPASLSVPRSFIVRSAGLPSDPNWFGNEWADYRGRFVSEDGRVVDNANGGVSHSEGQGYGLLLSAIAGDRATFARIWTWTKRNLYVRPDGLASWKWDPIRHAVADPNNATDGDILIAWALGRAAQSFDRPDYLEDARRIAQALGRTVVADGRWGPYLLPGVIGFRAPSQADGPVVNLSYWVFPAFPTLKRLAPEVDWLGVGETGLSILKASAFGPLRLPADWIALGGPTPRPAANFPQLFGYDAIRIPLYLAWAGHVDDAREHRFSSLWSEQENLGPFVIDIATGSVHQSFDGDGYRLVAALSACVVKKITIPGDLLDRRDALYYPATLRMLVFAAAMERHPSCL